MQLIRYPDPSQWDELVSRPVFDPLPLLDRVKRILLDVQTNGYQSIIDYEKQFDHVTLNDLEVSEAEKAEVHNLVSKELKEAILIAKQNIEKFHAAQDSTEVRVETMPGVVCWQKATPIEKVGLYVPGGTAPLFSTVLMLAVPAKLAGCREIILCSPPDRNGKLHPAILFAAIVTGVDRIFKIGGVQAIGAMAYGAESIPKVDKIFGPGNQYVTAAKQWVNLQGTAIDLPAGPSEVEVIADETARPDFVAADLLSQAEHGVDSQAILLTTSETLAEAIVHEIERQMDLLPRKEIAAKALENSRIIVLHSMEEIIDLTNRYAPEHLIIETQNYIEIAEQIEHAGSIFLGHYSPESAGDYASGTNHTLPTNGYAKAYSGVCLDSFRKKISFQEITQEGINRLGKAIAVMAENEGLDAHKNAAIIRMS
ncbi:MAG: histidinol dehydrogenase [Dysgonamonadaceae bacterium]|jgi:histidinol dehydrogenase|nr:histidinol dehydrogenase [Dysgonamonadaceae bacterium]